jgi:3-(3-hydroxy-phenyl)propionate hydroxylase
MGQGADTKGYDTEVLIVGLGPVGAALAALLAQYGVSSLAVDKDAAVYPLPRAAHFDHEIMRLFQQLGLAHEALRHSRPAPAYEFRSADDQLLLSFPSVAGGTISGWASGYMFNQPGIEHALRAKLEQSPLVQTRLDGRFTRLTQDQDGVVARFDTPDGEVTHRAQYLVGCDGAHSPVREAVGIKLLDLEFDEPWLVIDAVVTDPDLMPKVNLQICDPARPTTCVLMGPGRHRWEFMLLPGERPEDVIQDDFIQGLLASWDCAKGVQIDRKAVYRFHGLVADQWRKGRVLLAGDSAHQMPPFAGQGLCSGLRDAANLAWKLKAVIKDEADPALLDTYQPERDPHVRALIGLAIGMGRVVCTLDPQAAAQRDAGMLAQRAAGGSALPPPGSNPFSAGCILKGSAAAGELFPQPVIDQDGKIQRLDDVLGDGPWLITLEDLSRPDLAPFAPALSKWLERNAAKAVLVRPDRYVFGTGEPEAIRQAYETVVLASGAA